MRNIALGLILALLIPRNAISQTDWQLDLDSVTVQASRIHIPANRMGKYVTVLDQSYIRSLPANSLDELLRWIPGLEMQMRGPAGAQADISVRGSTFNQVLVLLDGVRLNDPLTGHFSSYVPVPVSSIKRVEVLRGPAAAQFGSDAVGAVINLVTFTDKPDRGIHGSANGMLGENEWHSWDGTLALNGRSWGIQIGSQTIRTDGHEIDTAGTRSDLDSRQFTIAGHWRPSGKWDIKLRGAWDNRDFAARYFYTRSPFDQSREQVSRTFSTGELRYTPAAGQQVYLRTGYQVTTDSFLFNPAFTGNFHTTQHWDVQTGYIQQVRKDWSWNAGAQLLWSGVESNDRGDHRHIRTGAFILGHWSPNDESDIHGGVRLEYDEVFGWAVNPQLAAHYRLSGWAAIRGFAGRGIRAADFTERFVSTQLPGTLSAGRNVGNPDLNAEKSWSIEAGTDIRWPRKILHRVTGFYRLGHDLIDYVLTPGSEIRNVDNVDPASDYFYTRNIASLNVGGMEYLAEFRHEWKEDRWIRITSGLTLVHFGGDTDTRSKYIANSSRLLWQNSMSIQMGKSNITLQHLHKMRDPESAEAIGADLVDAYHLWSARISYRPLGFIPLALLVQADNIFDAQYSDVLGARMPGRWIKGGLSLQF